MDKYSCWLKQTNHFPADSVGGCLERVVCSGYRSVGNSCGLHDSSCCLWYVKSENPSMSRQGVTACCCILFPNGNTFLSFPSTGMNTENTESQRMNKIMSEIQALQEVVTRFRQMRLDATEFACLKCIVTFKAGV